MSNSPLIHHSQHLGLEVAIPLLEFSAGYEDVETYNLKENHFKFHQIRHSEIFLQKIISQGLVQQRLYRDGHTREEKTTRYLEKTLLCKVGPVHDHRLALDASLQVVPLGGETLRQHRRVD